MAEWMRKKLAEVVELRRGFDLPARSRKPGKFPVLSAGVTAGSHDEGPIKGPGFVVGRATNLGVPTWSDGDFWPLNTTLYASDFKGNHPRFLYHLFEVLDLAGFDSGSVQPMLNRNYIAGVEVRIPDLVTQAAIVEVLQALDDKIAANKKMIVKADDLARAKWTLACRNGSTVPLSSLARFVNGKAFTKDASGTGRVVIRIAELNSGIGASTVYNSIDVSGEHLARPGDLLFAWSGSLTIARWFREEAIVNQHIFKVIPKNDHPIWLVNQALRDKLQEFKAIAADKATTMGHIQRRHLDEPVTIPGPEHFGRFDGLMSALWERALAAEQENLQLESTRDELLPLLMSGTVRVRDIEKIVEGVV
ncbi:restriction endonuclease subunit S [Amycolatopsis magusensis]|uniref:restriction endonuclease subunit S n=1 Tax=Amycolatopsis magusensis TaxID=882444 RepID=UPI0037B8A5D9